MSSQPRVARLLMILSLVFCAHRADAGLIVQNFNVDTVGPASETVNFDIFDTSLGTLTGVFLFFNSASYLYTDQFDCPAEMPFCRVDAFLEVAWLTGDGSTTRRYTADNFKTFMTGESIKVSLVHSNSTNYSPFVDLTPFTVTAPRLVVLDRYTCRECSGGSPGSGTQNISGSLRYTYETPVPTTIVLFALGLMGLGVSRRGSVVP
jgi:hypothetical protein